jgi:hypothetical protein
MNHRHPAPSRYQLSCFKPPTSNPAPNGLSASRRIGFSSSHHHRRSARAARGHRAPPHVTIGSARQPLPSQAQRRPRNVRRKAQGLLEPRSSFACLRLATSPIQPCPSPLAFLGSAPTWGCGAPRPSPSLRHAPAPPPPHAGRAQTAHRCERSSHGARRVGLPFGPARSFSSPVPPRAFYERCVRALTPFASLALRALSPQPTSLRSHHAASGYG